MLAHLKKRIGHPYQLGKFSAIRNIAFSLATSATVLALSCQRASWQDGRFQTVLRTLKSSAWRSFFEKRSEATREKLYLLWSQKVHLQGNRPLCEIPAWGCKGPERWETGHLEKTGWKCIMSPLIFDIGTSSHQPFVLNESPYEYPESQLFQLKNVTVQWATGT